MNMKPFKDMSYFRPQEILVSSLIQKTQNRNPLFFRISTIYYMSKIASMMRTNITSQHQSTIPVNAYAINLSVSGSGKDLSNSIIENEVIHLFKDRFLKTTFPSVSTESIRNEAASRSIISNIPIGEVIESMEKEFANLGPLLFSFDSGTSPAVKQMRHKLLMAKAGSINLEINEIGSNLLSSTDVLNSFLELYDVGKIKPKLIKNTAENLRNEEIEGNTPTNMLLYGTPSKLLNGSKIEEDFLSFIDAGFGRRCLFGYSTELITNIDITPEQLYDRLIDKSSNQNLINLSISLGKLADEINFNRNIPINKDESILLLEYRQLCEAKSRNMREFESMLKAEMNHRYFKALKIAGCYAFIESSQYITKEHLYSAFKVVEDSGEAFKNMLNRPRAHERIAVYLASAHKEVTQVDLMQDLPFFKGSSSLRKDMLTQAIAWGYRNNIIIRTSSSDGIDFFKGESMATTDPSKLTISYSTDMALNYLADYAPWDELHKLVCADGMHYTSHHFKKSHRHSDNVIQGFNVLVLDIDKDCSLKRAKTLLSGYKALFATTKSHTKDNNRFRILMPLSHTVKLNADQHYQFMANIFEWLPIEVDPVTKDISRKWRSFNGSYQYTDGESIDALLFIPDTNKQIEQQNKVLDNSSLSNIERWLLMHSDVGSRSNALIKYVFLLIDGGNELEVVRSSVISFNSKLKSPLSFEELDRTVLKTAAAAIAKRGIKFNN